MSRGAFEKKLAAVAGLREWPAGEARDGALRKALGDASGSVVARAAAVAAELALVEMAADLEGAFERLLEDGARRDPQCLGKTAIVKALKDLGHRDAGVYLRGLRHVQREGTFGGLVDTAAVMRGSCALALVDTSLGDLEILNHLTWGLADAEKSARVDAALAIGQLGREEGGMLLRLRVLAGDPEGEVVGQCFASLLSLSPAEGVAFAGEFLGSQDADVRMEAACALAGAREVAAIGMLRGFWEKILPRETRRAVIYSLGGSPLREAADFLLEIAREGPGELTGWAVEALEASRFREEVREAVSGLPGRGGVGFRRS